MGFWEIGSKSEILMVGNTRDIGSKLASHCLPNFLMTTLAPMTYPTFIAPATTL